MKHRLTELTKTLIGMPCVSTGQFPSKIEKCMRLFSGTQQSVYDLKSQSHHHSYILNCFATNILSVGTFARSQGSGR